MGGSIAKPHCYDLRDLPADVLTKLTTTKYSVLRTGGQVDDGWMISTEQMCDKGIASAYNGWEDACATDFYDDRYGTKGMKFFMSNGWGQGVYSAAKVQETRGPYHEHLHGWRSNYEGRRTFWPTELNDREHEKEVWFLWLDAQLSGLKTFGEKGLVCEGTCCKP
jgi:hypothetical protein